MAKQEAAEEKRRDAARLRQQREEVRNKEGRNPLENWWYYMLSRGGVWRSQSSIRDIFMYSDIIIEGIEEDEMCRLENLSLFLFVLVLCCMCVYYV